jgi:hypothetical protein
MRAPHTFRNLIYLGLTFPLGLAYFILLTVGLSLGAGLSILGVGVVILAGVLAAARGLANFERVSAASLMDVEVAPLPNPTNEQGGFWGTLQAYLGDSLTWKSILYLYGKFFAGLILFPLGVAGVAVLISLAVGLFPLWIVLYLIAPQPTSQISKMLFALGMLIPNLTAEALAKLTLAWLGGAEAEPLKPKRKRETRLEDLLEQSDDGELVEFPALQEKRKNG